MTRYLMLKPGQDVASLLDELREKRQDSGGQVMTIEDVSALLQKPVSAIRELCKTRAQRGPHPLPFTKVGRLIRFDRAKIMRWLETMPQRRKR